MKDRRESGGTLLALLHIAFYDEGSPYFQPASGAELAQGSFQPALRPPRCVLSKSRPCTSLQTSIYHQTARKNAVGVAVGSAWLNLCAHGLELWHTSFSSRVPVAVSSAQGCCLCTLQRRCRSQAHASSKIFPPSAQNSQQTINLLSMNHYYCDVSVYNRTSADLLLVDSSASQGEYDSGSPPNTITAGGNALIVLKDKCRLRSGTHALSCNQI